MRNKVVKALRRLARATTVGAPAHKLVNKLVARNKFKQKEQPTTHGMSVQTHLVPECTKAVMKQLKKDYKQFSKGQ